MLDWIYDIPTPAFGVLVLVVFVGAASLTTAALRPFVRAHIHRQRSANDAVGFIFSGFAVLYGLLLGLLAVGAYANFSQVDENVSREAASLTVLYHMASNYPSPTRETVQGDIAAYTLDTIEHAWPMQEKGIVPPDKTRGMTALYVSLLSFKPRDQGEAVTHAETLRALNRYIELRRGRMIDVRRGLPMILWEVVAIGALIAVVFVALFDMELQVHLIVGGLFAAFLGVTIFLIAAMDHPFRGDVSITADAFRNAYDAVMAPEPPHPGAPPPPRGAVSR